VTATPAASEGRMRASIASGWNHYVTATLGGVASTGGLDGLELRTVFGRYPVTNENSVYRFEIVDDPRRRLEVELAFGPGGELFPPETRKSGRVLELPRRIELSWSAWAPGMQPVFGTRAEMTADAKDELVARIEFEAGYGAQIVLRAGDPGQKPPELAPDGETNKRVRRRRQDPESEQDRRISAILSAPPVPGVVLEIDGFPAGTSDAGGELRIRQRFAPQRLKLVGRGWRITALEKLPGKAPRYVGWMRRNP
jgi:hypothetical protein